MQCKCWRNGYIYNWIPLFLLLHYCLNPWDKGRIQAMGDARPLFSSCLRLWVIDWNVKWRVEESQSNEREERNLKFHVFEFIVCLFPFSIFFYNLWSTSFSRGLTCLGKVPGFSLGFLVSSGLVHSVAKEDKHGKNQFFSFVWPLICVCFWIIDPFSPPSLSCPLPPNPFSSVWQEGLHLVFSPIHYAAESRWPAANGRKAIRKPDWPLTLISSKSGRLARGQTFATAWHRSVKCQCESANLSSWLS